MILKTLEVIGSLHGYGIARRIEQTSENQVEKETHEWEKTTEIVARFLSPHGESA
jgi:hypothetical protein